MSLRLRGSFVLGALGVLIGAGCEREAVLVPEAPVAPVVIASPKPEAPKLAVGASSAENGKPPLLGSDPYGLLSKSVPSETVPRPRVDPSKLDPSALMAAGERPQTAPTSLELERDPRAVARSQAQEAVSAPPAGTAMPIANITADAVATRVIRGSGRPHVLLFYAAYCPACRKAMPAFVATARAYSSRGVGFTLASVDSDPDRFATYASVLAGAFEALWIVPAPGATQQALKRMGVPLSGESFGIPYLTVFDPSRRVVSQGHGAAMASIAGTLDALLVK